MFRRTFAWAGRHERLLSGLAMISGAAIDQVFFGRVDVPVTQLVFASYALTAFVSIAAYHALESRRVKPAWRVVLPVATQFALGGFWSGFLVFYGRSAELGVSWPFLAIIIAVLLGNELFKKYHARLVFTSVLYFFALYAYAIFSVPMVLHALNDRVFLWSTLAAVIAFSFFTLVLRMLGHTRFREDVWRIRVGAVAVLLAVNAFYFLGVLPPLPVAAKAVGVYHDVWHSASGYFATEETEPWTLAALWSAPTLHLLPVETASVYSAVFAPTALTTTIVHRWQWYDPAAKQWVTRFALTYPITGGSDGGYRGYSVATVAREGRWRVSVETADGRVIARVPFMVARVTAAPAMETIALP